MTKISSSDDENRELYRFGEPNSPIVVSMNTFQGMRLLDIRRYYFDKKEKELKPGRQGISFKEEELPTIFDYLANNIEKILPMFTSKMSSSEVSVRHARKEQTANRNMKKDVGKLVHDYGSWSGPIFFHAEETPSGVAITLNKRSKFVSEVINGEVSSVQCLIQLLGTLAAAKKSLDFDKKYTADTFWEYMELAWGQLINK